MPPDTVEHLGQAEDVSTCAINSAECCFPVVTAFGAGNDRESLGESAPDLALSAALVRRMGSSASRSARSRCWSSGTW
jgi:hypothetical protein